MSFVVHRVAKSAARYTDAGGREKCGYCRFFVAPRACGKVIGPVSPAGWCKYFSRQVAQQYGGGISGGGGASFDQNFLGGSLGAGAVFTRASTGMYYDSAGVLRSAAINTPRFDYDPQTLQLKGLLLEDASTNVALQSSTGVAGIWLAAGVVVAGPTATFNNAVAPDGTTTATRLVYPTVTGATATSVWYQAITLTATSYTFSVWLRGNVGGEQTYLCANLPRVSSPRVTLTTQWQRFSFTFTGTAAGWGLEIGTDLNDVTQTTTPAQTIYAWGAQVEALPYMSSHIPTTSVSVTRARDQLTYPAAALTGFTPPGGSWFAEFICQNSSPVNLRIIAPPDVSGGPSVMGTNSVMPFSISQYDGASFVVAPTTALPNTIVKGVSTWAVGQAKIGMNGGAINSTAGETTGFGQIATTGVRIMTVLSAGGPDNMSGYIRRISYWPRVLSDSEMQQVTT